MVQKVDKYKKALKKRDEFLKTHPHMKKYKQEIENMLNRCNPQDRMDVLLIMLGCQMNEFAEQILKLKDINERFII